MSKTLVLLLNFRRNRKNTKEIHSKINNKKVTVIQNSTSKTLETKNSYLKVILISWFIKWVKK